MHGFSLARDNCGSCIKMGGGLYSDAKQNRQQNKQKYDWNMSEHKM